MLNFLLKQSGGPTPDNITTTTIEITPLGWWLIALLALIVGGLIIYLIYKA